MCHRKKAAIKIQILCYLHFKYSFSIISVRMTESWDDDVSQCIMKVSQVNIVCPELTWDLMCWIPAPALPLLSDLILLHHLSHTNFYQLSQQNKALGLYVSVCCRFIRLMCIRAWNHLIFLTKHQDVFQVFKAKTRRRNEDINKKVTSAHSLPQRFNKGASIPLGSNSFSCSSNLTWSRSKPDWTLNITNTSVDLQKRTLPTPILEIGLYHTRLFFTKSLVFFRRRSFI